MTRLPIRLRPGAGHTLVAVLAGGAVTLHLLTWADAAVGLVGLAAFFAVAVHLLGVLLGLAPAIGVAAVLAVAAGTINVASADGPAWFEATVSGLLVYAAAESGWEALDRRDGSVHSPAALRFWLAQRGIVVLLTLVVAAGAAAVADTAPVRSILLQAFVAITFVGLLVGGFRRIGSEDAGARPNAP